MNPYLDIPSPAQAQATAMASVFGLANHGLTNLHGEYWNLPTASLYEEIVFRGEARISHLGPVVVTTGKHTARAAADKFIVREDTTGKRIWWGEYNRPFSGEKFSTLMSRVHGFLQGRDVFVQDCYAGADPDYRLPIRIVTEKAWHSLFARNMFMKIRATEELVPRWRGSS
jgi:phosphoenolpyruvate carboxykinase (ATP)